MLQTCEVYFNWFYLKIFPCVSLKWSKSIIVVTFAKNDHIPFLKVRKINLFFFFSQSFDNLVNFRAKLQNTWSLINFSSHRNKHCILCFLHSFFKMFNNSGPEVAPVLVSMDDMRTSLSS